MFMLTTFCKLTQKSFHLKITPRFISTQNTAISSQNLTTPINSSDYDRLIITAGHARDFAAVHRLLNNRFKDGCFNTIKTFDFITTTIPEADFPPFVNELVDTISRLNAGYTRKSAFDTLIMRLCKLNRIDESMRVINSMISERLGASVHSFYPILCTLSKKRRFEEAWRVIDLMKVDKVTTPDTTAYNYLLTAYCVVGDLGSAAKVLSEMERDELSADSRTYDAALVLGACKGGKLEGALVVLRRMEDYGVPVLHSTYVHVINAMLGSGYYAQVVEFVMGYGGRDQWLDKENFGLLASRLIGLGKFEEAKIVLKEMRRLRFVLAPKLDDFYQTNIENLQKDEE